MTGETDDVPEHVLTAVTNSLKGEAEHDQVLVKARVVRYWPDLIRGLRLAYGASADAVAEEAVGIALGGFAARPRDLRMLDLQRSVDPGWFQSPSMIGYSCYADRFGGTLAGVAQRAPYLAELGVRYLHLLPLLTPRPAPNDGGYAVADYRQVRPDLGTMDDLADLARVLRGHDISLALDLVLNHVAYEHEWARRARAGEQWYRDYFHVHATRDVPDAHEATLPEVFPEQAPGNFTWDADLDAWVWTTFNTWQWDLNWHNPEVFGEFADLILFLANQGVEVLRLDAIAFMWKRLGTNCQNQPEVHAITQALHAVTRIAAPGVLFKAEAIVAPSDLSAYLGTGEHAGKVSDLAYHNSLMVQLWSALAAGNAVLAETSLRRLPAKPPPTAWGTYVRCHDDIGWAVGDDDTAAVGWSGFDHRAFLSDWYTGRFPGSWARGLVFQENPATRDRRVSGTAASLAGLEAALEAADDGLVDLAVQRLLLVHAAIMSFGGIPLLYMGDELALRNDHSFTGVREHADDNRWVHRPLMPWDVAELRNVPGTVEHRMWSGLRHLVDVRSAQPAMDASIEAQVIPLDHPALLGWLRAHPRRPLAAVHNVSDQQHRLPRHRVPLDGDLVDVLTGLPATILYGELLLEPYQALWLVRPLRRRRSTLI